LRAGIVIVFVFVSLRAWGPAAWAKPSEARAPTASRAAVEARLRAYELPPSPDDLAKLGRGIDDVLATIAADEKVGTLIRARAVSALGQCSTVVARRFLEETIDAKAGSSKPEDRLLLRKAALALAWMGGLATPARLGPLLENPDPDVRLDAALGLGLTRLKTAAEILRSRLPIEPDARVRLHIGRQLAAIERAAAK
jgi:HEAT repeat protein